MDIESDLNKTVADYFARAYSQVHPKILCGDLDKVRILAPQFCIDRLVDYYNQMIKGVTFNADRQKTKWNGIEIIPGYELAIVIYHVDAALFTNDFDLVYKLELR